MQKIWDYVKGHLKVRIYCNNKERFYNLCAKAGINIWELHNEDDFFEGYIYLSDLKKLKPMLRRTKSRLKIIEKHSLLIKIKLFLRRRFLILGIIIFVSIIIALSQFIWKVDISSNTPMDHQPIQAILEKYKITTGQKMNTDIFAQCQIDILRECPNISWVKISKKGSTVSVRLATSKQKPRIVNDKTPCNIVAAKDAVIKNILCTMGEKKVEPYHLVKKGQILISGRVPLFKDEVQSASADEEKEEKRYLYVHSQGEVTGTVYYKKELPLPANASKFQESEVKNKAKNLIIKELPFDSVIVKETFTIYTNSKGNDILKLEIQCEENIGIDKEIKEKTLTNGKNDKH